MKAGDEVQVYTPWSANGPALTPNYHWFSGYSFVRDEGNGNCIVEHTDGIFAGERRRYRIDCVRVK